MKRIRTWMGTFYEAESREDEEILRRAGYRKICCGFGQGAWRKPVWAEDLPAEDIGDEEDEPW